MQEEINFDDILNNYRADPFDYHDIKAPHTGIVDFCVHPGDEVEGVTGEWRHIAGTKLYNILREGNKKPITSQINGIVSEIHNQYQGQFVEAGTKIMTIKHPMKKREIIDNILKRVLTMFNAPERAKYFFCLDIQSRIDKFGQRAVTIQKGDELLTMSLMKRDTPVYYEGETGIIHSVYFQPGDSIEQGEPMIGICPKAKLPLIEKIITRVKAEWE